MNHTSLNDENANEKQSKLAFYSAVLSCEIFETQEIVYNLLLLLLVHPSHFRKPS